MRRSANPQDVLRSLAGLKRDSFVGFLPVIPSNPKAEHALHDLRAIALRFLDMEFLSAIRPSHPEPAQCSMPASMSSAMPRSFKAGTGISRHSGNLGALHEYLLNTPEPDIINYDLQAFLVTLRAAREAMPALAATTAALAPLLTEQQIFRIPGRPPEHAKLSDASTTGDSSSPKFFGGLE